jgi:hypothetical protein
MDTLHQKVFNNYPQVVFQTKMLKDANFYCLYLKGNVLNKITSHLFLNRLIAIKVQHNLCVSDTKSLKDAKFYCLYLEGNLLNKIATHLSLNR